MTSRSVRSSRRERGTSDTATPVLRDYGVRIKDASIGDFLDAALRRRRRELIDAYYSDLEAVEDRRSYVAEPVDGRRFHYSPPRRLLSGSPARFVYRPVGAAKAKSTKGRMIDLYYPSASIGFREPSRVVTCIRRKIRRAVLHAIGVAGLSPRRFVFRKRRRDAYSSMRC